MTAGWIAANLWSYSVQVALVVLAGSIAAAWLRPGGPAARLLHWRFVLAACLLLPLVQPWRPSALAGISIETGPAIVSPPHGSVAAPVPWTEIALSIAGGGVALRLAWLAMGVIRLSLYRRRSVRIESPEWPGNVEFRLSGEVSGPITFGFRRPVILLPPRYRQLPADQQQAICLHELLHVERHDWLVMFGEELVRAVLWFHPAVWWVLGQIQLAREQTVDRAVIARTRSRTSYLEALLAVAGGQVRADLAPAPLFLRRRQLEKRVESLMKEISMSTRQVVLSLTASALALVATAGIAVSWLPLRALAQTAEPASQTKAQTAPRILHKVPAQYPPEAEAKGIQGSVTVEILIDEGGKVVDAKVLSGPEELRRSALQSVLQWHFVPDVAKTAHVVVEFRLSGSPAAGSPQKFVAMKVPRKELGTLKRIDMDAVSAELRETLTRGLTIREGDPVTTETVEQVRKTVAEIGEHLRVGLDLRDGVTFRILPLGGVAGGVPGGVAGGVPGGVADGVPGGVTGGVLRVGGNMQSANLVSGVRPVYPPLAKLAKVQGTVRMTVTIARDGTVQNIVLVSGDPLLAPSAMEAVKQWLYRPTLLNGEPIAVVTTVDVNFTLAE